MLTSERPAGPIIVILGGLLFLLYLGLTLGSGELPTKPVILILVIPIAVAIVFKPLIGLTLLLCSYAYCLPIGYGSFAGVSSEWRLYDLVFVGVFVCASIRSIMSKGFYIRKTLVNKPLRNWVIMCYVGTVVTALTVGLVYMPVVIVRLFRLSAYAVAFVLVVSLLKSRKEVVFLIDVFIVTGLLIGLVSTLQHLGIVPQLWGERYAGYGNKPVATLAPHHKHIGIYMILSLGLLVGRAKTLKPGLWGFALYSFSCLLVFPIFAVKTRTGMLGLGCYFAATLLLGKSRTAILIALIIGALVFFYLFGDEPLEFSRQVVQKQIDKMTTGEGLAPTQLSRSRMKLYKSYPDWIANYPPILLWGTGFQSSGKTSLLPNAPHNGYVLVWFELGLAGIITYLLLLRSIWKQASLVARASPFMQGRIIAREYLSVYVANLIMLMVGGYLYPQRAMFSFLGTFMFVTALVLHPLWLKGEQSSEKPSHRKIAIRGSIVRGHSV